MARLPVYKLKKVRGLIDEREYDKALNLIDGLLSKVDQDDATKLLHYKAEVHTRLGEIPEAIEAYDKVIESFKDDEVLEYRLKVHKASALAAGMRLDEAIELLEEAAAQAERLGKEKNSAALLDDARLIRGKADYTRLSKEEPVVKNFEERRTSWLETSKIMKLLGKGYGELTARASSKDWEESVRYHGREIDCDEVHNYVEVTEALFGGIEKLELTGNLEEAEKEMRRLGITGTKIQLEAALALGIGMEVEKIIHYGRSPDIRYLTNREAMTKIRQAESLMKRCVQKSKKIAAGTGLEAKPPLKTLVKTLVDSKKNAADTTLGLAIANGILHDSKINEDDPRLKEWQRLSLEGVDIVGYLSQVADYIHFSRMRDRVKKEFGLDKELEEKTPEELRLESLERELDLLEQGHDSSLRDTKTHEGKIATELAAKKDERKKLQKKLGALTEEQKNAVFEGVVAVCNSAHVKKAYGDSDGFNEDKHVIRQGKKIVAVDPEINKILDKAYSHWYDTMDSKRKRVRKGISLDDLWPAEDAVVEKLVRFSMEGSDAHAAITKWMKKNKKKVFSKKALAPSDPALKEFINYLDLLRPLVKTKSDYERQKQGSAARADEAYKKKVKKSKEAYAKKLENVDSAFNEMLKKAEPHFKKVRRGCSFRNETHRKTIKGIVSAIYRERELANEIKEHKNKAKRIQGQKKALQKEYAEEKKEIQKRMKELKK